MAELADQRGQAAPLVLVAVVLAALVGVGVAGVGEAAGRRAQAQAAADAAALAGAVGGEAEASRFAEANDSLLVFFGDDGESVTVEVTRSGVVAQARARWLPQSIP